jgi:hypothetical protein
VEIGRTTSLGAREAPLAEPAPVRAAEPPTVTLYDLVATQRLLTGPETHLRSSRAHGARSVVELRAHEARTPPQLTGWNFDWDDNIFFMPTEIRLYRKDTGEEIGVSTTDFALIREEIGKPGKWEAFEMREGSLRFFGDDPTGAANHFAKDVASTLESSSAWKGPSWDAFVTACSREETAKQTTIITARLHSPETIHEGLKLLQRLGLIEYLPPIENIYPVNYPPLAARLGGTANSPSAAKALVMREILDHIQKTKIRGDAKQVITPDGKDLRPMHLWGFSDDDFGNYQKAITALSADIARWPDVKIAVFFTGKNHPTEKPRVEVLMPNGKTRPATKAEIGEAVRVVSGR